MLYHSKIKQNSELNIKEGLSGSSFINSYPQRIIVQVTNRCQLQCPMCLINEDRKLIDLPDEVLSKLEEVIPYTTYVALSGGEPLLYKKLPDFFDKFAKPDGPIIDFVTNGILLDDKLIINIVEKGVAVYISLNGATKETHELTRPGTRFEDLLGKFRKLSDLKKKTKSKTLIGISYVMIKNNMAEMPKIIDLMENLGIDTIRFAYYLAGSEYQRQNYLPDQDKKILNQYFLETRIRAFEKKITAYVPKFYVINEDEEYNSSMGNMERKYPTIENPLMQTFNSTNYFGNSWECHEPWTTAIIDMEGLVHPCCMSYVTLGDLKKQSFSEIWNGELYKSLRSTINTKHMPQYCRECPTYSSNYPASLRAPEPVDIGSKHEENRITSLIKLGAHYLEAEGIASTTKRLNAFVMRRLKK